MDHIINILQIYKIGDFASIIGVLISLIGFGVTIYNVVRSKTAAEKAEHAAQKTREDINRINVVMEFASAISAMEEIKRLQRREAWELLPERYSSLRTLLISIKTAAAGLTNSQKSSIQSSIQHLTNLESQVEQKLAKGADSLNAPDLNLVLSKQLNKLNELMVIIKTRIGN